MKEIPTVLHAPLQCGLSHSPTKKTASKGINYKLQHVTHNYVVPSLLVGRSYTATCCPSRGEITASVTWLSTHELVQI